MDYTGYTDSQIEAIDATERIGAALSVLGCSFVISTFIFSNRFRRPVNRIMFFASMSNLVYTIPGLIASAGLDAGSDSGLCQAQAFFVQAFLPADAYWNLSMALNVYFTVFKGNDMARLQQREPWYIGFNVFFPLIIAIILACIPTPGGGRIYGDAVIWCWISNELEWLRIATCYGPAWICIASAFAIYIAAGLRIRRERLKLLRPSIENGQFGETHLAEFDILAQTTVQTEVTTEEPPPPPTAMSTKPPNSHSYKPSNRSRYQVHISTAPGRSESMAYSDPVRKYTKSCMLFFISLLMTWVPSSINRVWALANPPDAMPPFGLAFTAALVLQFTGCWNSIVYITMSRQACQELFELDILPYLRRGQGHSGTKSPLIWHNSTGQDLPSKRSRRVSLDTLNSGSAKTLPNAPSALKTLSSPSQTETSSTGDSIASWEWGRKKSLDQ